jgi:L-alanine-DL-glutamate epimerase-like enolase superfamily enzyme
MRNLGVSDDGAWGDPMKIVNIRCYRQLQPFRDGPYVISGGRSETGFDSLIVRLEAEDGHVGWGEMAPLGATYDASFAEAARAAAELLAPALIGAEAQAPAALARRMDERLKGHPYAKSAFDMAAWDLVARVSGRSLCDLLGGRHGEGTALYRSLSRGAPEAMAERAVKYWEEGYRRLQVKVGGAAARRRAVLRRQWRVRHRRRAPFPGTDRRPCVHARTALRELSRMPGAAVALQPPARAG